jgi:Xaa-Pro dipeptidase
MISQETMDSTSSSLITAQNQAQGLFNAVLANGLIRAGKLESELTQEIRELARSQFGCRRDWHKRIVRAGPNTLLTYHDDPADRPIMDDDVVYLDFGPVFGEWEADFGRTYALGGDPVKHRLVGDLAVAFRQGRDLYERTPDLETGQMYDFVCDLARAAGWEFGATTAGHLIGHFPHERPPVNSRRFSIRRGNPQRFREPDADGRPRHWILEIHFVDRARQIGGFYEQLLTA